jgi:hypothetical protein
MAFFIVTAVKTSNLTGTERIWTQTRILGLWKMGLNEDTYVKLHLLFQHKYREVLGNPHVGHICKMGQYKYPHSAKCINHKIKSMLEDYFNINHKETGCNV